MNSSASAGAPAEILDENEFSRRFEAVRRRLWLIAAAVLCDRIEADDIVQESALVGLRKRAEFTPGTQFDSWIAQITRNLALNARRTSRRRASANDMLARHRGTRHPSSEYTRHADRDLALLAALPDLEETARICLLLRVVGELPYVAIASTLEIPEGTAQSHVHRARRRLRELLAAHDPSQRGGGP